MNELISEQCKPDKNLVDVAVGFAAVDAGDGRADVGVGGRVKCECVANLIFSFKELPVVMGELDLELQIPLRHQLLVFDGLKLLMNKYFFKCGHELLLGSGIGRETKNTIFSGLSEFPGIKKAVPSRYNGEANPQTVENRVGNLTTEATERTK